jgi:very-short-patch-repair endonuclease
MVACAPWGAAGEFAASRHGALTRSQAAERGISSRVVSRLLRDEVLDEPAPGVLVLRGSPPTWHQRLYVATLACKGAGAAGFRSAAGLSDFDGYGPGPLELLLPNGRHTRLNDVIHHRGPMGPQHANDFTQLEGIRCTGIARTLCDLGSVDPRDKVKAAFESVWRRGVSLVWLRETAERLHRPGQRGTGVLMSLLEEAVTHGTPTESALETFLENSLDGIPGLVRQHAIFDASHRFVARVDFAIPELKIAIDAHSRKYHFGPDHEDADAAREATVQAEGWIVRYVTKRQAHNRSELRSSLLALIEVRRAA